MAESDGGSGSWLMTYADFITLMMIFFIVLYTFTPGVEKDKFEAIIGAFQGKNGVLKFDSVFSDEMLSIEMQRAKNWEELRQMIKANDLENDVEIEMLPAGVRITLGEAVTFATYSAQLIPKAREILKVIARSVEKYTLEPIEAVEVTGHTDNRPVVNTAGKYPSNWELGAARSISVVKFLVQNSTIEPKKYEASTFGKYRPKASNNTDKGKRENRRVEIFVRYFQNQSAKDEKETAAISSPSKTIGQNYE